MNSRHEPTLVALFCALTACGAPPVDPGSTTATETDDEVGTSETESTTETSGETTGESETDTTSETGEPEPICGDGVVGGAELCDDGNAIDDDGCSNACAPRLCPVTWSRIDDEVTLSSSKLDNAPLAELPNGDIVIGNTLDGASGIDVRVQVWTPDGDLVWEVVHELGALRDGMGDVLADASGDIFLGAAANVGTDGIAKVLRLSGTDGSILWTYEIDIPGALDRTLALALDDQNRVLAALQTGGKSGETDVEVRALDPMTGLSEWSGNWTSEGNHDDWPTAIGFDATSGQIWVMANAVTGAEEGFTPTLLSFAPPNAEPVLVTVPIDDGVLDFDNTGSLVFDAQGRLWISVDDVDDVAGEFKYTQIAQIDKADGSVVTLLDSRDMAIDGTVHDSWAAGEVDGLANGGLVLVGWTQSNAELALEHYGYVVALDAEGQHDCVARFMDYPGNYPFESLGASSGAIFVNGFASESGDWHSLLLRVR